MNGLPGPFIKYFLKKLGDEALFQLADKHEDKAFVSCSIAYYDGTNLITVTGCVNGRVVSGRGDNGFGFDCNFIPDGSELTYAEMSSEEKDSISHRSKAIALLIDKLSEDGVI